MNFGSRPRIASEFRHHPGVSILIVTTEKGGEDRAGSSDVCILNAR